MSESEIFDNFEKFKKLLLKVESRRGSLEVLLDTYGDRIATAPGHDRNNKHAAVPGGLVKRSLQTFANAREICRLPAFSEKEIDIESVIVVSLLHDIGRIGDDIGDYYLPQTSSWHLERGINYVYNPDIRRMTHPHRGLYLLQSAGVKLTQDEWMAIVSQPTAFEEGKFYVGHEIPLMALLQTALKITGMQDSCGPENN
jgi:hypothetical protein